ncbi:hypothetical protein IH979_03680 [Patescibacteria group bacterium]|nr:hypothetical protein [Patescibacteria group bacterium]
MNITEALENLQDDRPIIVGDKTITPDKIDEIRLETGERVFWIRSEDHLWLSIDPNSEEVILFHDIDEMFDKNEDSHFYANDDYEFSYEAVATVIDEDGEEEPLRLKEYEERGGKVLRITEFSVSGDIVNSIGRKVPEEELQALM